MPFLAPYLAAIKASGAKESGTAPLVIRPGMCAITRCWIHSLGMQLLASFIAVEMPLDPVDICLVGCRQSFAFASSKVLAGVFECDVEERFPLQSSRSKLLITPGRWLGTASKGPSHGLPSPRDSVWMVREAGGPVYPRRYRSSCSPVWPRSAQLPFWDAHQGGRDAGRPREHLSHPCPSFYSIGVATGGPVPVNPSL